MIAVLYVKRTNFRFLLFRTANHQFACSRVIWAVREAVFSMSAVLISINSDYDADIGHKYIFGFSTVDNVLKIALYFMFIVIGTNKGGMLQCQ